MARAAPLPMPCSHATALQALQRRSARSGPSCRPQLPQRCAAVVRGADAVPSPPPAPGLLAPLTAPAAPRPAPPLLCARGLPAGPCLGECGPPAAVAEGATVTRPNLTLSSLLPDSCGTGTPSSDCTTRWASATLPMVTLASASGVVGLGWRPTCTKCTVPCLRGSTAGVGQRAGRGDATAEGREQGAWEGTQQPWLQQCAALLAPGTPVSSWQGTCREGCILQDGLRCSWAVQWSAPAEHGAHIGRGHIWPQAANPQVRSGDFSHACSMGQAKMSNRRRAAGAAAAAVG